MSLQDTIQEAIQSGFAAMDDIPKLSTYTGRGVPTYDATTGASAATSTVSLNVPMIFTRYSRRDVDNVAVLANDQKAIIASLDLDQTPTLNDTITQPNGTVWSVIAIAIDPAGAAWVLQVRRP